MVILGVFFIGCYDEKYLLMILKFYFEEKNLYINNFTI